MSHTSRVINYQISVDHIDKFPAKLKEYAGREVEVSDIHSMSCNSNLSDVLIYVTLWNSTTNPFSTKYAL